MENLAECIEKCIEEYRQDQHGNDIYVIESPDGTQAIVNSCHLIPEKKKYLCSKPI